MTFEERKAQENEKPQRRRLVFGGELKSLALHEFGGVPRIDLLGLFPDSPIEPDPAPPTRIA